MSLGSYLMQRDASRESTKLGKAASRLAGAKGTGRGIGGLLGSIALPLIGAALAPLTGGASLAAVLGSGAAMGAIGGGLGSMAGGAIGGATSGIEEGDLSKGKFLKNSRNQIRTDMAQNAFGDTLKSAATGGFQGFKAAGNTLGAANEGSKLANFSQNIMSGVGPINPEGLGLKGMGSTLKQMDLMGGLKGYGKDTIADLFPKSGDVTGDASLTDVPGLKDNDISSLSPQVQGLLGEAFNPLNQVGDVNMEDANDWETLPDGRSWSPSLGQFLN